MRRINLQRRARLGVLAVALLPSGCSRALPDPPSTSPLAPASTSARPLAVDVALRGDPPLPGESGKDWPGLVTPTSKGGGHEHHGHHGHAKPKPEPTEPEPAKGGEHDH